MRITAALVGATLVVLVASGCSALSTATSGGTATAAGQVQHDPGQVTEISYSPGATVAVRVGERFTLDSGLQIAENGGHVVEEGGGIWRAVSNGNVIVGDYSAVAPCSGAEPELFNLTVFGGEDSLSNGLRRPAVAVPALRCG